jgi:hypothetical protein
MIHDDVGGARQPELSDVLPLSANDGPHQGDWAEEPVTELGRVAIGAAVRRLLRVKKGGVEREATPVGRGTGRNGLGGREVPPARRSKDQSIQERTDLITDRIDALSTEEWDSLSRSSAPCFNGQLVPVLFVADSLIPVPSIAIDRPSISITVCACRQLSTAGGAAAVIRSRIQKDANLTRRDVPLAGICRSLFSSPSKSPNTST